MRCVILAAGMATRLRPLTSDTPKCLLKVGDRCLLQRSMDALIGSGCKEFVIVTGFLHNKIVGFVCGQYHLRPTIINGSGRAVGDEIVVDFIHNRDYEKTNNIHSLYLATKFVHNEQLLLVDSDLLYDPEIAKVVLESGADNVIAMIRHRLGEEEMKIVLDGGGRVVAVNKTCDPRKAAGESLGIEKMGKDYVRFLHEELERLIHSGHTNLFYEHAFEELIKQGQSFEVMDVSDYCSMEIDTPDDLDAAIKQWRF